MSSSLSDVQSRFNDDAPPPSKSKSTAQGIDGSTIVSLAFGATALMFVSFLIVLAAAVLMNTERQSCNPPKFVSDRDAWTSSADAIYATYDYDTDDRFECLHKKKLSDVVVLPPRDPKWRTGSRTGVLWKNVSYWGIGGVMGGLQYSKTVFNDVAVNGVLSVKSLSLKDSLLDEVTKVGLKRSIVRYLTFNALSTFQSLKVHSSLIGSVAVGETALLASPKFRESLLSEVNVQDKEYFSDRSSGTKALTTRKFIAGPPPQLSVTGVAELRSPSFVRTSLRNVKVEYSLRMHSPVAKQSRMENISVGGDFEFNKAKLRQSSLRGVTVEGSSSFASFSAVNSDVYDFTSASDALFRSLYTKFSHLSALTLGGAILVDNAKILRSTVEQVVFGKGFVLKDVRLDNARVEGLSVYGSGFLQNVKIYRSELTNIELRNSLEETGLKLDRTHLNGLLIKDNALLLSATFNRVRLESFVVGNIARFTRSSLYETVIDKAAFLGKVGFENTKLRKVTFRNVTFAGEVSFSHAALTRVNFIECLFKGPVDFSHASRSKVKFTDVKFEGAIHVKKSGFASVLKGRRPPTDVVDTVYVPLEMRDIYELAVSADDAWDEPTDDLPEEEKELEYYDDDDDEAGDATDDDEPADEHEL